MVHAESSTFDQGLSKAEAYQQVQEQAAALFTGQRNWVSNLANAASLLYHALQSLPKPSSSVNWAGFYVVYPENSSLLVLGPFMGHVACQTIKFGRGVCGTAASKGQTILVTDVEKFPGHIACDSASKSEIVVPILKEGKVVAIIDIDCAEIEGFDEEDQRGLQVLADILSTSCDWPLN